jgi:anti-anti-sigma factor
MNAGEHSFGGVAALPDTLEFSVEVGTAGPAAVVAVTGELDIHTVGRLRDALAGAVDAGAQRLIVDLTRIGFIDSVGLGAILHTKKRLGDAGRLVVVLARGSYAGVIFDVVGADAVVDGVFPTRAQAVAAIGL